MSPTWTCTSCEVTARFADPERTAVPAGWTEHGDGWRCLACGRAAAVEAALADAGVDADAGKATTAIRHQALAAFELRRDADRPDPVIAKPIGVPARAVSEVRHELLGSGAIQARPKGGDTRPPEPKPAPKPRSRWREPVEAALRADAQRTNAAIAAAVGCDSSTVGAIRRKLEKAGEVAKVERRGGRREKAVRS